MSRPESAAAAAAPAEIKGIPYDHYCLLHSTAHVMAAAVRRLWPDVKLTVGPPIARPFRGFYYDMDLAHRIGPEDLPRLEKEMEKIVKENVPFVRKVLSKQEAIELFRQAGQVYKLDLIEAKAGGSVEAAAEGVEGDAVTIYQSGDFIDLCKGPHVDSTGRCRHFKLLNVSGSYLWGDSRNQQIQRLYGIAWPTKEELKRDLARHESAVERDHRKIGRDLKLFQHHPESPGTIFWLPKGTMIYNLLSEKMRRLLLSNGYVEVRTPLLYNKSLWVTSGHWEKFRDKLFTFGEEDDQVAGLKPMNCPAHMLIYRSERRSYRELPLRLHDQGVLHRKEDRGAIEGIRRSFQFCQDDAHIFVRPDQVEEEITSLIGLVRRVYGAFGIEFRCVLSVSDWTNHPERWLGTREMWEKAESALARALERNRLEHKIDPNEAAFYGPKIDFITPNIFGEFEHQCATIQLDFNLPERFNLIYVDSDNTEKRPIVVHRAIYGSFERFIASIIEHTAGKFPMWLAPVQVKVLTISAISVPYGREVYRKLAAAGIRAEFDDRDDKISFKIRNASIEKVPYILVVGAKEAEKGSVNVRCREAQDKQEEMAADAFIKKAVEEAKMEF
ncbi:MAG: threonine--tRNA ligase [Planctomycetes bacterium]|nr:threonine--tRNA ligase [Planctomycetota bacterium]